MSDARPLDAASESVRLRGVYERWAPVYDALLGRVFRDARRRSIDGLALQAGERVLLSGAGTGLDLPLLPAGVHPVALDITLAMLRRARDAGGPPGALITGDAMRLPFAGSAFDAAILHLILAVAPDGGLVLDEACRALRPGGRIAVFDKFASEGGSSPARRALNRVTRVAGTEIDRTFSSMLHDLPLEVTAEATAIRGAYRIIWLRRVS